MAFQPGELDQRITIERETLTSDGQGGNTKSWNSIGDFWAKARPISGKETEDFDRLQSEARYLFVIRYPNDVQDSDRIIWDDEQFNIRVRKKPKFRELYMQIEAERGVAQ